jgi:alkyl hydroperoxide reductase subunit AhpC
MLPADESGTAQKLTAENNATARSVFVIGQNKKIKLMMNYSRVSQIGLQLAVCIH